MTAGDKGAEILKTAQHLMQTRGYNGFSFRDVAAEVGIRSASIHYHFATKADLAEATAKAYRLAFDEILEGLSAEDLDAPGQLRAYGALFVATLNDRGKLCLGGILASEIDTLPPGVRQEIEHFFDAQQAWLEGVLERGQAAGDIRADIEAGRFAGTFVAGLEGAMIVARSLKRPEHLSAAIDQLIDLVTT